MDYFNQAFKVTKYQLCEIENKQKINSMLFTKWVTEANFIKDGIS